MGKIHKAAYKGDIAEVKRLLNAGTSVEEDDGVRRRRLFPLVAFVWPLPPLPRRVAIVYACAYLC